VQLPPTFRRLSYDQALELYGTDKPDLRFGMELQDLAPWVEGSGFQAFKDALSSGEAERQASLAKGVQSQGGGVKALVVPGKADYSRKQIDELEAAARIYRAKGMAWMKVNAAGGLEGGASKFFADNAAEVITGLGAKPGDLILMVADAKRRIANIALGAVRSKLGKDLGFCNPANHAKDSAARFEFAWIVDFPMFEFNEEENKWDTAHHMFTWPQEQYQATMETDPGSVKGDLYDLVLNGFELASGSIRIHDPELQKRVFKIVGFDPVEAEKKFGFLTEAFKYGAPPHGGIAPGLDRLVMLMAGETSIKEVIAFPKNSFAVSPMDECPSDVDQKQLDELHLSIRYPEK
jgi:aspartyl-tRNA synthetase